MLTPEDLGMKYEINEHFEAFDFVEEMFDIQSKLCVMPRTKRLLIYFEMLRQTQEAMLIDGGPTVAVMALNEAINESRSVEREMGRKKIGPFLS